MVDAGRIGISMSKHVMLRKRAILHRCLTCGKPPFLETSRCTCAFIDEHLNDL